MAKEEGTKTGRKTTTEIIKKEIEKRKDYGERIQEGYDELPDPTPAPRPQPAETDKK